MSATALAPAPSDAAEIARGETASAFVPEALVGTVVGGRYRILSLRGIGGMGAVYQARHEVIERIVAVKVLLPVCGRVPDLRERFFREARAANRIQHPAVVDVLDLGRTDDGLLYLVMEYFPGETLHERMSRGPMAVKDLLGIVRRVSEGLGAAHDVGIVHRDVTPSNIFLLQRGPPGAPGPHVKLLDFGIAFLKSEIRLTRPGEVVGTPSYLAPETVLGKEATPAVDIYALGAVMYEALSGRPPFEGTNFATVAAAHVGEDPVPVAELCAGIPVEVANLVMRCLEKHPSRRPGGMQEVMDEVDAAMRVLGAATRRSSAAPGYAGTVPAEPAGAADGSADPVQTSSASGIAAWKEYLVRARRSAARRDSGDAAMRVAEIEFAIAGLESTAADAVALADAMSEAERKEIAARERFDRALDVLREEEARLADRLAALGDALEPARMRRENVGRELAAARTRVVVGEWNDRAGRAPRPDEIDPLAVPDEALVHAYRGAADAAARYEQAAEAERAARRAVDGCGEELRDVRYQIEQLVRNSERATGPLGEKLRALRRQSAALDARSADLHRKLIDAASALSV